MMRIIGLIVLALTAFALTLVAALALSGNLNKEKLQQAFQKDTENVIPEEEPDPVAPWAQALKEKEEALNKREAELKEREAQLERERQGLIELKSELTAIQSRIDESLQATDTEQQAKRQEVADSLSKMKPANAAKILDDWVPDEAAEVLRLIQEKDRGKILDSLVLVNASKAAEILRIIQEKDI